MASLNDRDAGRDFEGNGPSSFDRRDYREAAESMDLSPRIPGAEKAVADAVAQIERAFGKFDRATGRYVPAPAQRVAA
jgi:hypothetical protein